MRGLPRLRDLVTVPSWNSSATDSYLQTLAGNADGDAAGSLRRSSRSSSPPGAAGEPVEARGEASSEEELDAAIAAVKDYLRSDCDISLR